MRHANPIVFITLAFSISIAVGSQINPQERVQQYFPEVLNADQEEVDEQLLSTSSTPKPCTPILDFQALIEGSTLSSSLLTSNSNSSTVTADTQSRDEHNDGFSFPIGNIDLPLTPGEGSINSAMKLIYSLSNQFVEPDSEESMLENLVKFQNNRLHIQGLNLTMLNVHLYPDSEPKFGIGVVIKNTTLTGQFTYKGPILLSGYYRMSIDNVYLVASSNLTKVAPSTNDSHPSLRTSEFKMNITNLGYISIDIFDSSSMQQPTTNYLLKMLQRLLQKTIKRTYYSFESYIKNSLEKESRDSLDCELSRFSPLLEQQTNTANQQLLPTDLIRIISNEIMRSQLGSVSLLDFEHQQSVLGTKAAIKFTNGSLSGLDHLKFNGETRIKLQDEHLHFNTSIGWTDLRLHYNWSLILGNTSSNSSGRTPISKGIVAFNIKEVDFDAVITKGIRPHTRFVVDQLEIRRLESPKMEMSGLPGMNRITKSIVNFFMGRLKQRLSNSIQPALKQQLERTLNRIPVLA